MDYRGVEEETLMWINRARTNPMSMVQELKDLLGYFNGRTFKDPETQISVQTNEVGQVSRGKRCRFRGDCHPQDPECASSVEAIERADPSSP